jgi:hypothetical protein
MAIFSEVCRVLRYAGYKDAQDRFGQIADDAQQHVVCFRHRSGVGFYGIGFSGFQGGCDDAT